MRHRADHLLRDTLRNIRNATSAGLDMHSLHMRMPLQCGNIRGNIRRTPNLHSASRGRRRIAILRFDVSMLACEGGWNIRIPGGGASRQALRLTRSGRLPIRGWGPLCLPSRRGKEACRSGGLESEHPNVPGMNNDVVPVHTDHYDSPLGRPPCCDGNETKRVERQPWRARGERAICGSPIHLLAKTVHGPTLREPLYLLGLGSRSWEENPPHRGRGAVTGDGRTTSTPQANIFSLGDSRSPGRDAPSFGDEPAPKRDYPRGREPPPRRWDVRSAGMSAVQPTAPNSLRRPFHAVGSSPIH